MPLNLSKITKIALITFIGATVTVPLNFVVFFSSEVLAQTVEDKQAEALELTKNGLKELNSGQFQKALEMWQRALKIAQEIGHIELQVNILNNLGLAANNLGYYPQALEYYQQALEINQELGSLLLQGRILGNLGHLYLFWGNYPLALEYLQKSLIITQELKDKGSEATVLMNIAEIYSVQGLFSSALENYQEALAIFRELNQLSDNPLLGLRNKEAIALTGIGSVYYNQSKYQEAEDFSQQALKIFQEINDLSWQSKTLNQIGYIFLYQGKYPEALNSYQQALTIATETKDTRGIGTINNGIALVFQNQGNYFEALKYYQQGLVIHRQIENPLDEGRTLNSIGTIYTQLGQFDKALNYLKQSREIRQKIGDQQGGMVTLGDLGSIYLVLGQYSQAKTYLLDALKLAQSMEDEDSISIIRSSLGLIERSQGNYEQALQEYQLALAISEKVGNQREQGNILNGIGLIYLDSENYPQALTYFEQSLAIARTIGNSSGIGTSLNNLGTTYRLQKKYTQALDYFQQALNIKESIKASRDQGIALHNLGEIYMEIANYQKAEENLSQAINFWESIRIGLNDSDKISIFETQTNSYKLLQKNLIAQNKTQQALEISERGRARAFVELLAAKNSDKPQPKVEPLTIPQIQQIAKAQKATLVEYSLIPEEKLIYIWVIKPTGEIIFKQADFQLPENLNLNDPESLNRGMQQWIETNRSSIGINRSSNSQQLAYLPGDFVTLTNYEGFTKPWQVQAVNPNNRTLTLINPDYNEGQETLEAPITDVKEKIENYIDTRENLQKLYQQLITPIESHLPTNPDDKVIFIPHGELFLIPFVALQDNQGKYLIEKHTILTSPSIQVLQFTRQNRNTIAKPQNPSALVVGNPTMPTIPLIEPPQPLSPLPGAEKEAEAVSNLLSTKAFIGKEATKTKIVQQMPQVNLIHLATHGLLDDIRQLGYPGAIALAPTAEDNGFLTSGELINMKLKADLVVLSACNTGGGKISGDGVIGLSRSLISAGVPSVIVSLWSVPDAPTAELMTEFYHNYLVKKMNKAQALRAAMLTTKAKHPNPVDWAAFTIIGEAD